jgi:hypothetical protein
MGIFMRWHALVQLAFSTKMLGDQWVVSVAVAVFAAPRVEVVTLSPRKKYETMKKPSRTAKAERKMYLHSLHEASET